MSFYKNVFGWKGKKGKGEKEKKREGGRKRGALFLSITSTKRST